MDPKLLSESRKTAALEEEADYHNLVDEHTFDIEIQRMYVDKLKEQRAKIDTLTGQYRGLKQQLEQKEQLLLVQERKLAAVTDQAAFKKKYEDTFRALKQTETECDKLKSQNQGLREQLAICAQQKNTLSKEMKAYLKDTDFKLNQELCSLREVIEEKQKIIDSLKHKHAQEIKKLTEEAFKRQLQLKAFQENSAEKQKHLTDEIAELNRVIDNKDDALKQFEGQIDRWEKKSMDLEQQLINKQNQMEANKDQHQRLFQKMKFHIRSIKKQLLDREDEVVQQKQNLGNALDSIKKADHKANDLAQQLRLQKQEHEELFSRANFEWSQDKKNFSDMVRQFKQNIDDLIKVKTQLIYENDQLHAAIKQKEMTEKVRNCLSGNEHSEINRVDRIMRRI